VIDERADDDVVKYCLATTSNNKSLIANNSYNKALLITIIAQKPETGNQPYSYHYHHQPYTVSTCSSHIILIRNDECVISNNGGLLQVNDYRGAE
jgi:hypothetical protein